MKFTYEEYKLMISAAWNAFSNTLKVWGLSDADIDKFYNLSENSICKIDDYVAQVIKWEDDESI